MADQLLFETSNESQVTSEPFISRQVVYVIDQNNGNYSGQIQLDTSSLSNSGKFASFSEAYLQVPIVITFKGSAVAAFQNNDFPFGVALKNGFHQLIHSLSVEYNNTNVIQLTPFSNFHVSYKLMTTLSEGDVKKIGDIIGFYPDNSSTFQYQNGAAATAQGNGSSNNRNYFAGPQPVTSWTNNQTPKGNEGMNMRQQNYAFSWTNTATQILTEANGKLMAKDYYSHTAGSEYHYWYIMATIRLKDIHDFFDKMPLVKGAYLRFNINVNTSKHTLKYEAAAPPTFIYQSSATVTSGGSSSLLVASIGANQGLAPSAAATANDATVEIAVDIGKSSLNTAVTHPTWGSQTRLYVPLYTLNPVNEEQYLSLNRNKKIVYRDIYQYRTDVTAGNQFNALLTNGIPNPKTVIIIPFIQSGMNDLDAAGTGIPTDPYLSPFASEPATTSPLIAIRQFNIQIAGVNMFIQNEDYDFEQFCNELSPQNAINGGLVDGLTSGLISKTDFQQMYRYYVCDVSRRLPAEDTVPKSVQILGTNQTTRDISLFTFVEYQREVTIDLQTGQLLQ